MNISISHFEVNSISSIGSINIGKTILCHNKSKNITTSPESPAQEEEVTAIPPTPVAPGALAAPPAGTP